MERGEEGKVARGYTERGGEGVLIVVNRGELSILFRPPPQKKKKQAPIFNHSP